MQAELQILKPKLLETSDSTEKLMVKIEQNTVKMEAAKEVEEGFFFIFNRPKV